MSGLPVIIVDSGGWPVTISESVPGGMSMTVSDNGYGFPVTVVASGGMPVSGISVGPTIVITGTSVSEDAAVGTAVGTLSVTGGSGTYAYAMTGTAGGKFAMDGAAVETAAALDYETASSHVITVTANNGVDAIISRNITVIVINVADTPTLDPLENAVCISAADDDVPDFEFDLPGSATAGMVIAAEYSVANADSWSSYFDHTITAQNIIDDTFIIYGLTPLAEGTWDFRFRLEDGAEYSTWETIEDVPINFAPTITTFLPADGATTVATSDNLVITFNKNIQFGTGDINIYKSADDTLFENFDVVTHAGTKLTISSAALTINPSGSFVAAASYYVQIESTAIQNTDEVAFAGIADETTYNFTAAGVTEYELKVDTFYSSGTWTSPADIRASIAKKVELWAAGGAAVAATGSGGGGAYSAGVDVAVTPSTGYAVVVGVGAVATNGTNSTFNSTTVVAEGGKAIGSGSSGGLAANGTGTTKYSGGNGAAGGGNVTCGTAAGSEGAGNNISIVGGYPDGAWATATATNAVAWGCGARSSATLGGAGGKGHCRISYEVPRTAGFPYCVGRRAGRTPTATAITSHTATYPVIEGGILAGDLIFLIIHNPSSTITLSSSGYASLDVETNSTNLKVEVFTKTAAGGETGTFTISSSSNSGMVWLMLVYRDAGTPVSVSNNGSSISPTFLVNNMGSTGDRLWLAVMGTDPAGVNQNPPTAASSGFSNIYIEPGHIQACELRDTVSSKTPGTHTLSLSEQWCTFNIAIPFA